MKTNEQNEAQPVVVWYERVFEASDLKCKDPELKPLLEVDEYPEWVVNVIAELSRQGMHLSPAKELVRMTPKRLGQLLGQKYANFYALMNRIEASGIDRPEVWEKALARVEDMEKHKDNPAVASALEGAGIAGSLILDFCENVDEFEKIIHDALKEALAQANHAEAVLFFQGFANGLASTGLLPNGLAQSTDATPIYYRMFLHWPVVDKLGTVTELYDFLLKVGMSKSMLGDIDRLRTLCKRIKYAPGKRGRPVSSGK